MRRAAIDGLGPGTVSFVARPDGVDLGELPALFTAAASPVLRTPQTVHRRIHRRLRRKCCLSARSLPSDTGFKGRKKKAGPADDSLRRFLVLMVAG